MSAVPKRKLTEAEYLAIERDAEFKSEFYNGVMYPLHWDATETNRKGPRAMAGASRFHNSVKENLIVQLGMQFDGKPCRTYSSDQRVRLTETGMYAYPDIVIVCDPPEYAEDDPDALVNPQVVIEILSPSTERYDRGFKFAQYRQRKSIREYVLVSQDEVRIERFVRQPDDSWLLTTHTDPDAEFEFRTVPAKVKISAVYRDVDFDPAGD